MKKESVHILQYNLADLLINEIRRAEKKWKKRTLTSRVNVQLFPLIRTSDPFLLFHGDTTQPNEFFPSHLVNWNENFHWYHNAYKILLSNKKKKKLVTNAGIGRLYPTRHTCLVFFQLFELIEWQTKFTVQKSKFRICRVSVQRSYVRSDIDDTNYTRNCVVSNTLLHVCEKMRFSFIQVRS